jgi:tetratricopeptide (TPR) repeat protein
MGEKGYRWVLLAPYVVVAISGLLILGSQLNRAPASKKAPSLEWQNLTPLPTPDRVTREGIDLFLAKKYKAAIKKFNTSIEANPKSPIAYAHSAHAHVKLRKYPNAITLARKALELNPHESLAMLALIDVEYQLGRYRGAIELADRFQDQIEDWAKGGIFRKRAFAYSSLKQFNRAIADIQRAVELEPEDPELHCALVGLYAAVEDDRINEALERAKELFPEAECVLRIAGILNEPNWL